MWRIIMLCIVTMSLAAVDKVSYDGYKLFRIIPRTNSHLEVLKNFKNADRREYSYWREPIAVTGEVLLMVSPHNLTQFYDITSRNNITDIEVIMSNIQKLINGTISQISQNQPQSFDFTQYHSLDTIYKYLDELANKYPNVEVVLGGATYERRVIKGVKIINDNGEDTRGIFIEGGMHAREWISPATVIYILNELLTSNDTYVKTISGNFNWFIFPVLNPDGYVFTHEHDRLWTKTRKPSSPNCIGSDPNRNWDFQWNFIGSSKNPCADNYPGSKPFSEIEMRTISEYIKNIRSKFDAYFSFHSFGQKLMFPYSYTTAHMYYYKQLSHFARVGKQALRKRYNTEYYTGCLAHLHPDGMMSGLSVDYIAGIFHKPVIFHYELRDKGQYGFLLPPEQIIPTGEETLDSLLAIVMNMVYYTRNS